jgi:hypothetical protein
MNASGNFATARKNSSIQYDAAHDGSGEFPTHSRILCGWHLVLRQQIQKTVAHLTGAAVPSSNERWSRRT